MGGAGGWFRALDLMRVRLSKALGVCKALWDCGAGFRTGLCLSERCAYGLESQ